MATNFNLSANSNPADIIRSLNYALATAGAAGSTVNSGNVLILNSNGAISTSTTIIGYQNQYLDIAYADSATGSGFSTSPTNKTYYGIKNTSSSSYDSNPVDYSWYQVGGGGFGTTLTLWYATLGGRQITLLPSQFQPQINYDQVGNGVPINLDIVTGPAQVVLNVNAYYQSNVAPATPSGGFYNFSTFTLTPPTGWISTIPNSVANTSIYVSSNVFEGNVTANVAPALAWSSPTVFVSQFNGNTGPQGARGFVPLGFVVCNQDPTSFTDTQYTSAFSQSRSGGPTGTGLGYTPITGDTAQFFYANLFNSNNDVTITKSFNSNTNPQWSSVPAQVVSGGLIVPGTITANVLNVNEVYAIDIQSTNANIGNTSSPGYWLQASTGSASFAGTVSIGNYLTIGAGAVIGSNLIVGDSAGIGNNLIVGQDALIGGNATIQANATIGNNATIGSNLDIGNNATIGNNLYVGVGATVAGVIIGGSLASNTVGATQITANAITTGKIAVNTITGNLVQANTIQGNSIVAGTITATQLAANIVLANVVVAGNIISFGATIENPAGIGYWLDYTSGNVYFGGNTTVGNELKVGANAQIGSNLTISDNLIVGQNAQFGSNLNVGQNAVIGNNLSVGTNATIGGVIIGGVLGSGTVGNTQIQSGIDGGLIASGTIGSTQIGSNAIITGKIAAGAVTAGTIAAGAVTAGTIAAGAVTANTVAANAITVGTVAAGTITSNTIAANAIVAGTIAANAISAYSMQANSVTGNAINANTITTTNLIFNSQTGQTSKGPDLPGTYTVAFVNGTSNVATSSGYLWPYNTRGLAIEGGVSYIPTTTGNIHSNATSYSHISVVYSGYVFSGNNANLVEVWKAGGSDYYAQTFNSITNVIPFSGVTRTYDQFYVVGNNNYWGYNINNGLTGFWSVNQDGGSGTNTSPSIIYQNVFSYEQSGGFRYQDVTGINGNYYSNGSFGSLAANVYIAPYYNPTYVTNFTNPITIYDQVYLGFPGYESYIVGVGSSGTAYHLGVFSQNFDNAGSAVYESTGILQTFYGVASNQGPSSSVINNVLVIAVGSNGTILQNNYTAVYGGGITPAGWTQKVSGTLNDLYAVASNVPSQSGTASGSLQWVAVGQYGTIVTSPDGNTWTIRNSGTTQNLNSVVYGNGYWVAVGNNSTIVYSTDGINWTVTQGPIGNDTVYRNLNSIAYGWISQSFNAAGQSIIMRATNPSTWTTTYDGGVSVTSQLTRLTAIGSDGSNIANITVPAANQQLGSQNVSGQYIDTNYSAGVTQTYYLVMGNLTGNTVETNGATLVITEFKR